MPSVTFIDCMNSPWEIPKILGKRTTAVKSVNANELAKSRRVFPFSAARKTNAVVGEH